MGQPVQVTIVMEQELCCSCGVPFGMPDYLMKSRRKDGAYFYCPNGHSQHYTQTDADRLRKLLAEANSKSTALAEENTRLANRAYEAEVAEQKAKRESKRLMKRVSAGVCPCCNRTFQNLARHMAMKHGEPKAEPT